MLSKHDRDIRAQTTAAAGHRKPKPKEPSSVMLYWNVSSAQSRNRRQGHAAYLCLLRSALTQSDPMRLFETILILSTSSLTRDAF